MFKDFHSTDKHTKLDIINGFSVLSHRSVLYNRMKIKLFISLSCVLSCVHGLRILGVFPFPGKSHFVMGEALMKGLAARGHEVVVVSHFPQKKPLPNYADRSMAGSMPPMVDNISLDFIRQNLGPLAVYDFVWKTAGVELCDEALKHPILQDLIHNEEKFDLFVSELWGTDCLLAFAHKFNVPHVELTTIPALTWAMARHGNPYNPAYQMPTYSYAKLSGMDFFERVKNTLMVVGLNIGHYFHSLKPANEIVQKYFGPDVPPLTDLVNNSTMLLLNSHFSMNYPIPVVPGVVEVGGLHIQQSSHLPQDIKKILDDATNGAILFSLGSLIQVETFEEDKIDGLLAAFSKLPQTIIWKFSGKVPNVPNNVKVLKWLPQTDVLAHPNLKLFVTHGGLMGTQEAIMAGVPMVGIPFFGDQKFNILNYADMGIAVQLNFEDISEQTFLSAVNQVLKNPSYSERSKFYSTIFKDRPQSAMDTAIYWTEYVARYNGAAHLKPTVTKLNWFQALLLDVVLFLVAVVYVFVYACKKLLKLIVRVVCGAAKINKKMKVN